ncbi:MAG: hypothetical protein ACPL1D_02590, partial [Microgenomates group bacterium]
LSFFQSATNPIRIKAVDPDGLVKPHQADCLIKFKKNPSLHLMHGVIEYRTDMPESDLKQAEEDLQKAFKVSLERQGLIQENLRRGQQLFLRIFGGQPTDPQTSSSGNQP